jgi:hypothetical protein
MWRRVTPKKALQGYLMSSGMDWVCKRKRRSPRLTGWAPASELLGVDGWALWVDAPGTGPEASALFGWRVGSSGKYYNE